LPFHGVDTWNAWELAWLDEHRRAHVASATIRIAADSPRMVESKSLKLYLNSFSGTTFSSAKAVIAAIRTDLHRSTGGRVDVELISPDQLEHVSLTGLPGTSLDHLPASMLAHDVDPSSLTARTEEPVSETLHTHLMKSHCPVTNQPDWASVVIDYQGPRINHPGLLQYLLSYRHHQGYHENCVERIFVDIMHRCSPQCLRVLALYTRRGGIDINPFRSSEVGDSPPRLRSWRQ
jgi:7-cyano-7-deazaguanine reductase